MHSCGRGTPFYPAYETTALERGVSPVTDQSIAGAIMTVEGMFLTLGLGAWLLLRWAKEDTARQDLLDFAERHGVALSEERAAGGGAWRDRAAARSDLAEGGQCCRWLTIPATG
jgi:hypothetical protein